MLWNVDASPDPLDHSGDQDSDHPNLGALNDALVQLLGWLFLIVALLLIGATLAVIRTS